MYSQCEVNLLCLAKQQAICYVRVDLKVMWYEIFYSIDFLW